MGIVAQMFGKRSLVLYLGTIASMSILFGYLFDTFFGKLEVLSFSTEVEHFSILDSVSTLMMFGLIGYYFIKNRV